MAQYEAPLDQVIPLVYEQLRQIAERHLRRAGARTSLHPTLLVHEAYLRLAGSEHACWTSNVHFLMLASQVMRQVMVDHARRRQASKRGGGWEQVTLENIGSDPAVCDILILDQALDRLAEEDQTAVDIVQMRCFGGMTLAEIATVLEVSEGTIKNRWRLARATLLVLLEGEAGHG